MKAIKVGVKIGVTKLTLSTTEKSDYIRKISKKLSDCIDLMLKSGSCSYVDTLILAGLNFVDLLEKSEENADLLRKQIVALSKQNDELKERLKKFEFSEELA